MTTYRKGKGEVEHTGGETCVVWRGLAWCGVVVSSRRGMVWYGEAWYGVEWHGV